MKFAHGRDEAIDVACVECTRHDFSSEIRRSQHDRFAAIAVHFGYSLLQGDSVKEDAPIGPTGGGGDVYSDGLGRLSIRHELFT
jgi:hypothetical protein